MEAQGAEAEERAFSNPHFYHVIPSQRLRVGHRYHPLEGVQNELPQNVSLWHVDYFEGDRQTLWGTGETSAPPLTT